MKKQWLVFGVICLFLCLFSGALFLIPESERDEKEPPDDLRLVAETQTILSVNVKNAQGGYAAAWEDGKVKIEGLEEIPIKDKAIREVTEKTAFIQAEKEIPNGEGRLSDFGLEFPEAEVEFVFEEAGEETLLIGHKVPDTNAESRYILWKEKVYVATEAALSPFFFGRNDFVSDEVSPAYQDSQASILVQKISLTRTEGETIVIELADSSKIAGYLVNSYQLTSPLEYPARDDLSENFLPSLFDITAWKAVELYPGEKELEEYGLRTPYVKAEVTYLVSGSENKNAERTFTLSASKPDENGLVYITRDSIPVIYQCTSAELEWLDADEKKLLSGAILSPAIRSLSKLTVKAAENTYEIILNHMGEENEEVFCNGKKVDSDSIRNLYYMMISQTADEILFSDLPDTDRMKKRAEIIYTYVQGTASDHVIYYEESTRRLYAALNGEERGYRLSSSGLEKILFNLEKLSAGEKIEARY